jgi:DNA-binding NtrC family response regulator
MFADKYSEHNGMPKRKISEAAGKRLASYHFPGNVRELENTMHRAILMAQEAEIEASAIILSAEHEISQVAQAVTQAAHGHSLSEQDVAMTNVVGRSLADVERDLILNTLKQCLGNRTHAANILGISIRTLRNKLNQYGTDEG